MLDKNIRVFVVVRIVAGTRWESIAKKPRMMTTDSCMTDAFSKYADYLNNLVWFFSIPFTAENLLSLISDYDLIEKNGSFSWLLFLFFNVESYGNNLFMILI